MADEPTNLSDLKPSPAAEAAMKQAKGEAPTTVASPGSTGPKPGGKAPTVSEVTVVSQKPGEEPSKLTVKSN